MLLEYASTEGPILNWKTQFKTVEHDQQPDESIKQMLQYIVHLFTA